MNNEEVFFTFNYLESKLRERKYEALKFIGSLCEEDVLRCDIGTLVVITRHYAISPPLLRFDQMVRDKRIVEATDISFARKTGVTYCTFLVPVERDTEWLDEIDSQTVSHIPIAFLDKKRNWIEVRLGTSFEDEEGTLKRKLDDRIRVIEQYVDQLTNRIVDFNKDLAAQMVADFNKRKQSLIKMNKELDLLALPQVINPRHEEDAVKIQNLLQRLGADMTNTDQNIQNSTPEINSFIVHGHDEVTLLQLKNYIQNTLKLGEPTILREQPGLGRTIIEKFEHHAHGVELVFVLLTPDDKMADSSDSNNDKRRARQNVILEMGFFLGAMKRESGRILLLHKGPLEIPSDISGVEYIDITNGIESAGEKIRRELRALGILK